MLDALVTEARLRFGLDPAAGLQIVAAERLIATPFEASRPVLLVPLAMLGGAADAADAPPVVPLAGRHGPLGATALQILARAYPPDHAVGRFGTATPLVIRELADTDLVAPMYLAPVAPEAAVAGPWAMPAISARLRAPGGCPWDQEQTHASLRKHLLEEAYEVYDALEGGATPALAGELGDLLLQVVLHAQLAAEAGVFDLADVQAAIATKIVRRHPHVFADADVRTANDVNRQWERIKADERAEAGADGPATTRGALDGISASLPALAASQEMQERAANIGYDWPSIDGVLDKVIEETEELREAADDRDPAAWAEEFGDLLFVLVNVARKRGIEAEAAVRAANAKFRRRFGSVERQAADRGVALRDLDFAALDELWDVAKAEEKITS
ncbi:MAG TPA: nucleoside triphosphate pyrophosphohydrolase [Methylomirabilota bacterium]|nr:nucleoside triphosphate pyrophosphohydrolase [Methylomirabilota bacterium]